LDQRRRTADRVFRGCLLYTSALTLLWLFFAVAGGAPGALFSRYSVDAEALRNVFFGFLFFSVLWGLIWYGVKNLLLRSLAGFSKEERRLAFSSRMAEPFDLSALLARHSERRIRIADMIGRRGRFMTLQLSFFYYLYARIAAEPTPAFLTLALQDGLFDVVVFGWAAIALYYSNGFLARFFYGAQSRVMDGTLARANCLLITTLWSAFRFVMVPIGMQLAKHFPPSTYATLFVLIWGAWIVTDASSEVVGSLFGKQKLRVWGLGDVNRKSIAGTWRLPGRADPLPLRGGRPRSPASLDGARRGHRHLEHALRAVLAPGHRRLHDGDGERASLLGIRVPRLLSGVEPPP